MRALRDMNLPKFIKDDERLFRLLLSDLFPSSSCPSPSSGRWARTSRPSSRRRNLQKHPFLLFKIGQLYDSKLTRHCNMLVGKTMAGKSTAWRRWQKAKTTMSKEGKIEGYVPVNRFVINSKSIHARRALRRLRPLHVRVGGRHPLDHFQVVRREREARRELDHVRRAGRRDVDREHELGDGRQQDPHAHQRRPHPAHRTDVARLRGRGPRASRRPRRSRARA